MPLSSSAWVAPTKISGSRREKSANGSRRKSANGSRGKSAKGPRQVTPAKPPTPPAVEVQLTGHVNKEHITTTMKIFRDMSTEQVLAAASKALGTQVFALKARLGGDNTSHVELLDGAVFDDAALEDLKKCVTSNGVFLVASTSAKRNKGSPVAQDTQHDKDVRPVHGGNGRRGKSPDGVSSSSNDALARVSQQLASIVELVAKIRVQDNTQQGRARSSNGGRGGMQASGPGSSNGGQPNGGSSNGGSSDGGSSNGGSSNGGSSNGGSSNGGSSNGELSNGGSSNGGPSKGGSPVTGSPRGDQSKDGSSGGGSPGSGSHSPGSSGSGPSGGNSSGGGDGNVSAQVSRMIQDMLKTGTASTEITKITREIATVSRLDTIARSQLGISIIPASGESLLCGLRSSLSASTGKPVSATHVRSILNVYLKPAYEYLSKLTDDDLEHLSANRNPDGKGFKGNIQVATIRRRLQSFLSTQRGPLEEFDLQVISLGIGNDIKVFRPGALAELAFGLPLGHLITTTAFGSGGRSSPHTVSIMFTGHADTNNDADRGHFDALVGVPGTRRPMAEQQISAVQAATNFRNAIIAAAALPPLPNKPNYKFTPPRTGIVADDYVRLHRNSHDRMEKMEKAISRMARVLASANPDVDLTGDSDAEEGDDLSSVPAPTSAQLQSQIQRLEKQREQARQRELRNMAKQAERDKRAADNALLDDAINANRESLSSAAAAAANTLVNVRERRDAAAAVVAAANAELTTNADESANERLLSALAAARTALCVLESEHDSASHASRRADAELAALCSSSGASHSSDGEGSDAEDAGASHPPLRGGADPLMEARLARAMMLAKFVFDANNSAFHQLIPGAPDEILESQPDDYWTTGQPRYDATLKELESIARAQNITKAKQLIARGCVSIDPATITTGDIRRNVVRRFALIVAMLNACRPGFSKDSRKFNALCFTVDGGAFTSGRHDLLNATQFYSDVCAALPEAESRVAIDVDLAAEPDVTARDAAAGSASTATANSTAAGAAAAAAAGDQ